MEPGLLVALGFAGNYVSGAFDADGTMVGACAGLPRRTRSAGCCTPTSPPSGRAPAAASGPRSSSTSARGAPTAASASSPGPTTRSSPGTRGSTSVGSAPTSRRTWSTSTARWTTASTPARRATACSSTGRSSPRSVAPPDDGTGAHAALDRRRRRRGPMPATGRARRTPRRSRSPCRRDVEALRASDSPASAPPPRAGAATFREAYAGLHEQGWRVRGFVQERALRAGPTAATNRRTHDPAPRRGRPAPGAAAAGLALHHLVRHRDGDGSR